MAHAHRPLPADRFPPASAVFAALLLMFSALSAAGLEAQTIAGRVTDAESGAPVTGAIVKAVGVGGDVGVGTLSDDAGRFSLRLLDGFEVTSIVLERIGFQTNSFDISRFEPGVPAELVVEFDPIEIGGIVVTAESLCRAGPGSVAAQTLWDEARKALEATAITANQPMEFRTQSFVRTLDPRSRDVLDGESRQQLINSSTPFRSITPDQIAADGWARRTADGGMDLHAPDASILLSDAFAEQHCFNAVTSPDALLLNFFPNDDRTTVPEIQGTMVFDRETVALQELRFEYVRLPIAEANGLADGELRFFAAPNGMRIVKDWAIRAPQLRVIQSGGSSVPGDRIRVDLIHEEGSRVLAINGSGTSIELPVEPLEIPDVADQMALAQGEMVAATRSLNRGGAELLLRNNTRSTYRVTEVRLRDCVNTALPCGRYPVDVLIEPGSTETVMRIRQQRALEEFSLDWEYEGEALAGELIAIQASATDEVRYDPDVIVAAQIDPARFSSALEVVSLLRPNWLRPRSNFTFQPSSIRLYVDNVRWGTWEDLADIRPETIQRIEWIDASTATQRWGTGHPLGAIEVFTSPRP